MSLAWPHTRLTGYGATITRLTADPKECNGK